MTVQDTSFSGGVVVLTGTNTYTGGTLICSCGSLQLGDATHIGSIVGAVTNEDTFDIVNANTKAITSILNDGGLTTFHNSTSASTIAITNQNGGETDFGVAAGTDTATAGNATIINTNGGLTTFNAMTTAGNAVITNRFSGETDFFDNSTAGNATIVNRSGGLTTFNDFATAGNASITTNNGGAVAFFDFSTGGNAQFITNGSGVVDFSGSFGPNGDGRVSAGSIAGSGTYIIGGGNTLTVGSNNLSTEVSGAIQDGCGCLPGSLEKVGTGTLTLSGNSNTYSGITFVNGGTLLVTGSIASSLAVVVDNGATLGGTGTVPITLLNNGSTLAPGLPTALGTLTVNSFLGFCECTFYNVKVTSGGSDLTQVLFGPGAPFPGAAGLAGTVRVTSLNSTYKFNSPYTILTAQGGFFADFGLSRFDALVTPAGINGSLSYTTTDVDLTLMSALGQLPGLNVNQRNVANALDAAFNALGSSGGLGAIFSGNIPQNLSQASGETATGTQQATFNAMGLFLGLLTDP